MIAFATISPNDSYAISAVKYILHIKRGADAFADGDTVSTAAIQHLKQWEDLAVAGAELLTFSERNSSVRASQLQEMVISLRGKFLSPVSFIFIKILDIYHAL